MLLICRFVTVALTFHYTIQPLWWNRFNRLHVKKISLKNVFFFEENVKSRKKLLFSIALKLIFDYEHYHVWDIGQPSLTDPIRRLLENEEAVEKAEAVVRKIFIEKWIPQVKVG